VTASVVTLAVNGNVTTGTAALTAVLAGIMSTGTKIILVRWSGPPELAELIKKTFTRFISLGVAVIIIWGSL